MAENDFDRTETATPRRREEARQEGSVARSSDLTAACVLLAGVLLLYGFGFRILSGMRLLVQSMLGAEFSANPTRPDDLSELVTFGLRLGVEMLAPILLGLAAVGLAATVGQVGFRVTPQVLTPNLAKLSPLRGLGNLFDIRAGMRLGMSLAKVAIIFCVAAWIVLADLPGIVTLSELETLPLLAAACQMVYALALKLSVLLLLLAILDYAYQVHQRERDLRMTKQEVRDELRRMEGDPLIKQRRARVARQLTLQRIQSAVPRADVVVTNPTHFAVALRYDAANMRAPKVIAKGADYLAYRIRQLAALHGVPMIERKDLARALYQGVEVGQEIPPQFYNAVAEILAYVYRLSGRKIA